MEKKIIVVLVVIILICGGILVYKKNNNQEDYYETIGKNENLINQTNNLNENKIQNNILKDNNQNKNTISNSSENIQHTNSTEKNTSTTNNSSVNKNNNSSENVAKNTIQVGMEIYETAKDALTSVDWNSKAVEAFNSKYEAYKGSQRGTSVRSLIDMVHMSNLTSQDNKIIIEYNGTQYVDNAREVKSLIEASQRYAISFAYSSKNGYIEKININKE